MLNRTLNIFLCMAAMAFAMCSCIEDDITTSPADQPEFSVDTLHMGKVFTGEGTPTHKFMVYNRHDKVLNISSISFKNGGTGHFRVNVDGLSGHEFANVEIRPNDSIYVFVEATLPPSGQPGYIEANDVLQFVTNGVTSEVVISALGLDVKRLRNKVITADTLWTPDAPHQVFDSLVVAEGATLRIAAGTRVYFHDKSSLTVRGTLVTEGTAENPVVMGGDRTGFVAADIPYEIMSRQWEGVDFAPTSRANSLAYTVIENTFNGVRLDSLSAADQQNPAITLVNCRLRNSGGHVLEAHHSNVNAVGCEFAEAAQGPVLLRGGNHNFSYCSFANYYLFSFISGPLVTLRHFDQESDDLSHLPYLRCEIANSILFGTGGELSEGDLTGTSVFVRRCLMRSTGSDDNNFLDCLWDSDPLWLTDRDIYLFDYRLSPESPAIGASYPYVGASAHLRLPDTDFYGTPHLSPASIGAMEQKQ